MSRFTTSIAALALAAILPTTLLAEVALDAPKGKVDKDVVGDIVKIVSQDKDSFTAEPVSVSISKGRTQTLTLDFGADQANREYVIAGSTSGIFPGTNLGTISVPLNHDSYTDMLLKRLDSAIFPGFKGRLDAKGRATAKVKLPKDLPIQFVGSVCFHSVIIFDPQTGQPGFASEVAELVLMP